MRGHIVNRYPGSYSVVIELDRDPVTKKRRQQWVTVRGSKTDAKKCLTDLLHQYDTGTMVKPAKTTVADFLNRWLTEYVKVNLSPRGIERYESITRVYLIPAFGSIHLTQLRPEHLQRHYAAMIQKGLAARSVRYHHVILHKALTTAMKWGLLARNVADGVDVPRAQNKEMQTWDENELNKFLEAAKGTQYYPLFYTALFTGMRRSELLALRWQDVDFVYGQISVTRSLHHVNGKYVFTQPKTKKSRRMIALPPSAFLVLEAYRKAQEIECKMFDIKLTDDSLVFNSNGKPLRPNTVTRAWHNLAVKAGIKPIRLHDARHTHASLLLKQGIHPKIVQERLGHSTIAITLDTYSHVAPGLQEAAAKKFDEILTHNVELEKINK